jgi:exodeoxyribonuclease VII large subunit
LLKARLEKEGLFDARRKRPIPSFPRCVGVITSPTGAAIRDILQVMARRFPGLPVILYPALVQGDQAPASLIESLRLADARGECDLLILARGGGSLEDLAAFNDERLARTIADLKTPVISAVGHEIDFTIADFVADRRAPTPSAAAELATPDRHHLLQKLQSMKLRLQQAAQHRLRSQRTRLEHARHKLRLLHPSNRLEQMEQRVDDLGDRLVQAMERRLADRRARLAEGYQRLLRHSPGSRLALARSRLEMAMPRLLPAMERLLSRQRERLRRQVPRLQKAMRGELHRKRQELGTLGRALQAVSPLQTLERGYSITLDASGKVLTDAEQVKPGDRIRTLLARGELSSVVESTKETKAR